MDALFPFVALQVAFLNKLVHTRKDHLIGNRIIATNMMHVDEDASLSIEQAPVQKKEDSSQNPSRRFHLNSKASRYLYASLFLAGVLLSAATYYFTANAEETQYKSDFRSFARETAEIAESRANTLLGQMDSLAIAIAAAVQDEASGSSKSVFGTASAAFPNATIPHLDLRTQRIIELTRADMILFVPFVEGADRRGFEQYAEQNQEWITQDYVSVQETTCPASSSTCLLTIAVINYHRNIEDGTPQW